MKLTTKEENAHLEKAIIEAGKQLIPPFILFNLQHGINGMISDEKLGKFTIMLRRAGSNEQMLPVQHSHRSYAIEFASFVRANMTFMDLNKMDMEAMMKEFEVRNGSDISEPQNGSRIEE